MTVGAVTFGGSMIAAGKLAGVVRQRPITLPGHNPLCVALPAAMALLIAAAAWPTMPYALASLLAATAIALFFGILFSIRVGGADMPVTIALLNALSGLAASICGFAVEDALLIAIGAIVGSAGLILTQIMCRAMNRSLSAILTGKTAGAAKPPAPAKPPSEPSALADTEPVAQASQEETLARAARLIADAKRVVVIPGYGMALAQAQAEVKRLFDWLVARDKDVQFAIHPVAGRMPGHMNVLLAEVDIPYERLQELESVNPLFPDTDIALIVGACDVVNPAANTAEGTPIYGMPILNAHEAKHAIVCNLDARPGYSGVDNPLYENDNALLLWGHAAETVAAITNTLGNELA